MYGAQTIDFIINNFLTFENDVEMYGAQTPVQRKWQMQPFENDVEMYGAQTFWCYVLHF